MSQALYCLLEAASRFELENNGFAGRRLTTWPSRQKKMERETGLEPATSTLARLHSTTELFPLNDGTISTFSDPLCQQKILLKNMFSSNLKFIAKAECTAFSNLCFLCSALDEQMV